MRKDYFNNVLGNRLDKIQEVLVKKNEEYANDQNIMHNFVEAGKLLNTTPEKALIYFMTKHIVSVMDMVHGVGEGLPPKSVAMVDEKMGDIINYSILLEAMLKERVTTK